MPSYTLTIHDSATGAVMFQQLGISEETLGTVAGVLRESMPAIAAARNVAAAVRSVTELFAPRASRPARRRRRR